MTSPPAMLRTRKLSAWQMRVHPAALPAFRVLEAFQPNWRHQHLQPPPPPLRPPYLVAVPAGRCFDVVAGLDALAYIHGDSSVECDIRELESSATAPLRSLAWDDVLSHINWRCLSTRSAAWFFKNHRKDIPRDVIARHFPGRDPRRATRTLTLAAFSNATGIPRDTLNKHLAPDAYDGVIHLPHSKLLEATSTNKGDSEHA